MNPSQLDTLEQEFNLRLPVEYRVIISSHPFPDSGSFDYELCGDVESVARENRDVRRLGFFRAPWESSWFVIGHDGCGNIYFITTSPFDGRIYFADHESKFHTDNLALNDHYSSFDDYLAYLSSMEKDIRKDEENAQQRIANRKWWQFWIPKKSG